MNIGMFSSLCNGKIYSRRHGLDHDLLDHVCSCKFLRIGYKTQLKINSIRSSIVQKDRGKCPCLVLAGERRRVWLEEMQKVVRRLTGGLEIPGLSKPELFGSRWEKSKAGNISSGA